MTTRHVPPRLRLFAALALALALARVPPPADAQESPASTSLPKTVDEALLAMAARAGVIFSGTIVAIDRQDDLGYVDIRFHIDEAVRNCPQAGSYVLREWSGLWAGGIARYRVGDRRLMLLHARGPSGLSSPINGLDGAIPLAADGVSPLTGGTASAPADTATSADPRPDLRWIVASLARTPAHASSANIKAQAIQALESDWVGPATPLPAPATGATPLRSVMTLLHGAAFTSLKSSGSPDARSREAH